MAAPRKTPKKSKPSAQAGARNRRAAQTPSQPPGQAPARALEGQVLARDSGEDPKASKARKPTAKVSIVDPALDEAEERARELDADLDAQDPDSAEETTPELDPTEVAALPAPSDFEDEPENLPAPRRGALSATDPLARYMSEVLKYPLLAPEEEFALARRMIDQGDLDAARRLVTANLRLVVKIAFEYKSVYSNILDLIQEGNIGLMKAVSKFDPTKGSRLGYYASWWIRSYVLKYLLDNFRLVKIGTTQAQKKLFFQLMREKERLEAQGIVPAPKLLAERLDVREKDVVEMQQRLSSSGAEVSLDTPIGPAAGESSSSAPRFVDQLPAALEAPDEALARDQLLGMLEGRLPDFQKTLSEREVKILRERLLADEPRTLQEVADDYGLTRERVRQIETQLLKKLRDFVHDLMGELLPG